MTTDEKTPQHLAATLLDELEAANQTPGHRTYEAVECLPAKPGSWCVAAGTRDVHGITTPNAFITPWGLPHGTAERLAAFDPDTVDLLLEAAREALISRNAIEAVRFVHRPIECRDEFGEPLGILGCESCKDLDEHSGERIHETWPCPTIKQIDTAQAGKQTYAQMTTRMSGMLEANRD